MTTPKIPESIDNDPISVQERTIRQFDCPNPDCDSSIDITNVNVGTKIKCKSCNNVTWLPDYGNKWWQKPLSIIGGILLSFLIGVASSMSANWLGGDNGEDATIKKTSANQPSSTPEGEG
ncbi:BRcat domain-containing protein [Pseudoalteromonas maricaloris]|uniref:BRcat domain-containing protein n=1 Tax=Pseudoalteromonas maricaloris TaxID=184924 RepID=UPI00057C7D91|nr:hypothetical protein [Pseudoalteromonas flavipulchra]KID33284.1 hypothetical protein QT15_22920 [Pseudoalteromonas flavipulchra NCIMB 2033 = ATCC BAA-314]MBD0781815.1 hypothetical protein [Pseudoalteromonas flavipulchra]